MTTVSAADQSIHHISETAQLAAMYRAEETARPDALFRDSLAERLAGQRGRQIFDATPTKERNSWAWVMRTVLFDHFILARVRQGVDTVINLAAGLDARPYRMELPPSLRWIEVDLPDLLAAKEVLLRGEQPACTLDRVPLDLSDRAARKDLIRRLGESSARALVITEGLLAYLSAEEVGALARDLAQPPSFQNWALDLVSPRLLRMIQSTFGKRLDQSVSTMKFAPDEGPDFFVPHGWKPVDVRSILKTAARYRRVPFWMRLIAMLPEPKGGSQGNRIWSGVCLMMSA